VARDFKVRGDKDREDLFASMPPLEAKKAVFRIAATRMKAPPVRGRGRMKLLFIDVRKAHLNGVCDQEVYVELPKEAEVEGKCGRLKRWLYGMRPAAQAWEKDYSHRLQEEGLERGLYSPVVFFNKATELRLVVHGDDFTFLGYENDLDEIEAKMSSWYDIKVRGRLGDGPGDVKKIDILNRSITWTGEELIYRADEKHAGILIREFCLEDTSKGLTSPIEKEVEEDGDELLLSSAEQTRYRALTARANYLAQDRADIQFAVKELCCKMSAPTVGAWRCLKRLCRYLLVVRNIDIVFPSTNFEEVLDVYADSDWAGCKSTRKSTSGGFICLGGGALKSWSGSQASVALSSGEAEFYAAIRGGAEAMGVKSLWQDLGMHVTIKLHVDSSSAKSMMSRFGVGRVRHLETRLLWIQQLVRDGTIRVKWIKGIDNPADVLTKPKCWVDVSRLTAVVGLRFDVRHKSTSRGGVGFDLR
jgi:hypothetical protein